MKQDSLVIHALLIDLDGVLRHWRLHNDQRTEQQYGLPPGTMRAIAFAPDLLGPAITGAISDETWRTQIAQRLAANFPWCDAITATNMWSTPVGEVDPQVLALLGQCRQHVPIGLVTNATSRLPRDLEQLHLTELFDVVINSSVVGIAKPNQAIFHAALDALHVEPAHTLFVDDQSPNVAAAKELGMIGHVYQGYSGFYNVIERYVFADRLR